MRSAKVAQRSSRCPSTASVDRLRPRDFAYFGLVDTGALVWDRIDAVVSIENLAMALAAEFGADPDIVRADVVDFVSALDAAGLLSDD